MAATLLQQIHALQEEVAKQKKTISALKKDIKQIKQQVSIIIHSGQPCK